MGILTHGIGVWVFGGFDGGRWDNAVRKMLDKDSDGCKVVPGVLVLMKVKI